MYARSIGEDAIDQASLELAAAESTDLWRVRDDWYTWADRTYDLTWSEA